MFPFFYFYEFHTLYILPPVQSEIASFDKFHLSHNGGLERLHSSGFEFSNPYEFHTLYIFSACAIRDCFVR